MAGNTLGKNFTVTTFGESHGPAVGCIVDGCPPQLEISEEEIHAEVKRCMSGQSKITSGRQESGKMKILSGVMDGKTLGTPITLIFHNEDAKSKDYDELKDLFRPSHGDFTYCAKYGIREYRGGGRASAHPSVTAVTAAGAIARKYLEQELKIEFISYTEQVGDIKAKVKYQDVTREDVESNIVRCPDQQAAKEMVRLIEETKKDGDSIGGMVRGAIKNVPAGLGEPLFDKLSADLAKAMFSINAVKGFEYGSGFRAVEMRGSEHNDPWEMQGDKMHTKTNNSGGIQAGISNGEDIPYRIAIKPTPTIGKEQDTVTADGREKKVAASGRHDPCIVPRAVAVTENVAALVIIDHYLRHRGQNG